MNAGVPYIRPAPVVRLRARRCRAVQCSAPLSLPCHAQHRNETTANTRADETPFICSLFHLICASSSSAYLPLIARRRNGRTHGDVLGRRHLRPRLIRQAPPLRRHPLPLRRQIRPLSLRRHVPRSRPPYLAPHPPRARGRRLLFRPSFRPRRRRRKGLEPRQRRRRGLDTVFVVASGIPSHLPGPLLDCPFQLHPLRS